MNQIRKAFAISKSAQVAGDAALKMRKNIATVFGNLVAMRITHTFVLAALLAGAPLLYAASAHAAGEITCSMQFEMHGWSIFYKTAKGTGEVTCSNGEHMQVHLRSKGGGLTIGKSSITGNGRFTGLFDIKGVLGTYATGGAHAGAVKTAHSTVMVKGNVALAMTGKGRGWNLGVDFGKFTISR